MSKNRKPVTKLQPGQVEISIVRFADGLEVRSFVKKMTRRQALNVSESKGVFSGQFTVEHAVVGAGSDMFGPVLRSLGTLECTAFPRGGVPFDYN